MSLGVPLLGVNEVGELGGVSQEEDRGVFEHPVPVTFLRPELDSETTGVASGVSRPRLASNGGETNGGSSFLTNGLQERLGGDVAQIVGDLEVTVGTSTFGVDLTLS